MFMLKKMTVSSLVIMLSTLKGVVTFSLYAGNSYYLLLQQGRKTNGYVFVQQTSDPCDSTLNSEFRTQRQTEFLLEAFHLQHRATETRQKLSTLQAETAKGSFGDELTAEAKICTRRALSSIRNNFKEIQRSLEIWLARILGDLEGMLARDGASRIREYFLSPYTSAVRWVLVSWNMQEWSCSPKLLYSVCMNTLKNPWIHDQQVKCHNQGHAHLCTPLGLFMDILAIFSKIEEKWSGILPDLTGRTNVEFRSISPFPGASNFDTKSDHPSSYLLNLCEGLHLGKVASKWGCQCKLLLVLLAGWWPYQQPQISLNIGIVLFVGIIALSVSLQFSIFLGSYSFMLTVVMDSPNCI